MIVLRYIWYYAFWLVVKLGLSFYFKKIKVTGIEGLPKNAPIIFGANHENAFMDALLITTRTTRFSHYLARADIFRHSFFSFILKSINILPVYRIRDGFKNLKSNNKIFIACHKVLAKKKALIMFPEGKHDIRRIPRKLTKGISRIALGAINSADGPESLYIVPVGLNYSDHKSFRSSVHIIFGKPILVKDQVESAINLEALRKEINEELLTCSIGLQENYYTQLDTILFKTKDGYQLEDPITINSTAQYITQSIESKNSDGLFNATEELENALQELDVQNWGSLQKLNSKTSTLALILLAPVYLFGLIQNLIPIIFTLGIIELMVKDKIFISSIKFSVGLILFPMVWYLQSIFFWDSSNPIYLNIAYWMGLPISLVVLHWYHSTIKLLWAQRKLSKNPELKETIKNSLRYINQFKAASI